MIEKGIEKMNKTDLEISIPLTVENEKTLHNLLRAGGIRHYLIEFEKENMLDVVEYAEYKKVEKTNKQLKEVIEEAYNEIEKCFALSDKTYWNFGDLQHIQDILELGLKVGEDKE